jgi:hypothetical protein
VEGARHADGADPGDELAAHVARLADRLRSLSDVRLAALLPGGGSRADAAHGVAQQLADAAADLGGEPRRVLPRLDDLVVGDQVAVTGADLVGALRRAASGGDGAAWRAAAGSAVTAVRALRDQV